MRLAGSKKAMADFADLGGSEDDIVASLEERRDRWQMSYHVIDDNAIDAFAPIVARLAGK